MRSAQRPAGPCSCGKMTSSGLKISPFRHSQVRPAMLPSARKSARADWHSARPVMRQSQGMVSATVEPAIANWLLPCGCRGRRAIRPAGGSGPRPAWREHGSHVRHSGRQSLIQDYPRRVGGGASDVSVADDIARAHPPAGARDLESSGVCDYQIGFVLPCSSTCSRTERRLARLRRS
jgi:hypothetical protein